MTIYLKEKDLQLFILGMKILLKMESLTKKKKKKNNIGGDTIKIIRKTKKEFIQKEIYFNKLRLVSKIKKKNDDKNVIFFKYCDKIYPFKLEITEPYIAKFSDLIYFFHLQLIQKGLCLLKTKSFLVQGILSTFGPKS